MVNEYDLFGFEDENNNTVKNLNVRQSNGFINLPVRGLSVEEKTREHKLALDNKNDMQLNGNDDSHVQSDVDEFDDDDDDDDQIIVKCGDINASAKAPQQSTVVEEVVVKEQSAILQEQSDFEAKLEHDLCSIREEDKPWKKVGADISEYFNFGFNEQDWLNYCEKQRRMRMENVQANNPPPAVQHAEKVIKKQFVVNPSIPNVLPQQIAAINMLNPNHLQMINRQQYFDAMQSLVALQTGRINQHYLSQMYPNHLPENSRPYLQNKSDINYSGDKQSHEVKRSPKKSSPRGSRYQADDYRNDDEQVERRSKRDEPDRYHGHDDHRRYPEQKQRDNRYETDSRPTDRQEDRKSRVNPREYRHERPNHEERQSKRVNYDEERPGRRMDYDEERPNRRIDYDDDMIEDNGRREDKFRKAQKNEDLRHKIPSKNNERRMNNESRDQRSRKRSRSPSLQTNFKRRA